jgi:hypothetical protein
MFRTRLRDVGLWSMTPKHPLFEQHWREFTVEHPEILHRSRYVLDSDREEAELSVDLIAFLHFVRWAKQRGYGPPSISGQGVPPDPTGPIAADRVCLTILQLDRDGNLHLIEVRGDLMTQA